MRVIVAAAGTAGHINPGLAIANKIKEQEPNSEIIFMNEVERNFIEKEISDIPGIFKKGIAKQVVVTLGSNGSMIYVRNGNSIDSIPARAATCSQVIDATGAGDSYIAGYMYGYLKGFDAKTCAAYASCEASFIIEQIGCTAGAPTEDELLERVNRYCQGE